MTTSLMKAILADKVDFYTPDGKIDKYWREDLEQAIPIETTQIADYCSSNPQFWGNYSRWQPIKIPDDYDFLLEYQATNALLTDWAEYPDFDSLNYLIIVDKTFLTIDAFTFKTNQAHQVFSAQVTLDDNGMVDDTNASGLIADQHLFYALFPLTVLSNPENNDVVLANKTINGPVSHVHSRNKKKRMTAKSLSKAKILELKPAPMGTDVAILDHKDTVKD